MVFRSRALLSFLLSFNIVSSIAIQQRQAGPELLAQYTTQVKTAIYIISNIQANNATNSCADQGLVNTLDASGYDGQYAQKLLCESAIGIDIFSDLNQAAVAMHNALGALYTFQADPTSPTRTNCPGVNVDTLDEAGLDGLGIYNAVCNISNSTSSAVTTGPRGGFIGSSTSTPGLPVSNSTPATSLADKSASSVGFNTPVSSTSSNQTTKTNLPGTFTTSASNASPVSHASSISTTEIGHTHPPTSTQANATSPSTTVVTTIKTTWVIGPPLSFSSTASMKARNGTTITQTITSTSTIDITTTVTILDSTWSFKPSSGLRHGPWQWHGPWRPYHHSERPSASGRHMHGTRLSANCTNSRT